MDTQKAVADRLLQLCEEKNLSVNALARISAVPPSTLKNSSTAVVRTQVWLHSKSSVTAWGFLSSTSSTQTHSKH